MGPQQLNKTGLGKRTKEARLASISFRNQLVTIVSYLDADD